MMQEGEFEGDTVHGWDVCPKQILKTGMTETVRRHSDLEQEQIVSL